jgi:hypothetical protein
MMSEYQYYEFQAIDRPLTPEEQEAVASLSSRVSPHPRRAVFTYNWGGFPANAEEVLAQYYDAMLYLTSWGTTQLIFRFPRSAIDLAQARAYCRPSYVKGYISWTKPGDHVVLNVEFRHEDGLDWIQGEGLLDTLIPLRDDLMRGDYRALYLAWLKTLEGEDVLDTMVEPPVPPGLAKLSRGLETLVTLLDLDPDLLQTAAAASQAPLVASDAWVHQAIARLSTQEREEFLIRLAQGEPQLAATFVRRLRALTAEPKHGQATQPRRTAGELIAEASRRQEQARQRQAEEAERKRIQALEALARREPQAWEEVHALIHESNAHAYDRAVQILLELRELSSYQGTQREFERRAKEISVEYRGRPALMRRLREAGLDNLSVL